MTEYMMKTDKNGKPRYYKSVDGKMKVISRAEYEENVKAEVEEVKSEAIVPAGFWNLDAAITELAERDRLNSVDMTPQQAGRRRTERCEVHRVRHGWPG